MKELTISLTAIVIAIFLSGTVYSQSSFSIHAGPSFPLSDFGDDDSDDPDAGGAGVGLNLGGKYLYKLNDKGLGLYIGADFNYNGLKSSIKEDIESVYEGMEADIDITYQKYINVPITAGINYTFKANEQVSLFADLGIGADFLKVTNMTIEIDNEEIEANYDLSTQLAYIFGGGLLLQEKYIIGLHYNGLGKHNVKGEIDFEGDTEDADSELKVDVLSLTVGIKF
jgi:hypothetical protein